MDDNLSYHKGNGCVIIPDDDIALSSDFVCDVNAELSSEFEGTVRVVPVKSISRPVSAAINIKHAKKKKNVSILVYIKECISFSKHEL